MSPASLATATTRAFAASAMARRRPACSPPAAAHLAMSRIPRWRCPTTSRHSRAVSWKRAPSRDARRARAASAGERSGSTRVSPDDARPHPDAANASRLLGLLRVNACVELVGSVAVAIRPDAVFPDVSSSVAGAECAKWYALALAAFALASFACVKVCSFDTSSSSSHDENSMRTLKSACFPVAASMSLYHLGVSSFLANAVVSGGASFALRGALGVHAPLALAFALATGFCARGGVGLT